MMDKRKLRIIKTNRRKLEEVIESLTNLNMDFDEIINDSEDKEVVAIYETIRNTISIATTYISDGKIGLEEIIYNEC